MTGATLLATSVICAGGFGAEQVWATARSRVSRVRNSNVMDKHLEPIPMGLVPDDALDPDDAELDSLRLPVRARRMLRLASPPLRALAPLLQEAPVVPRRATGASRDFFRCAPVALYLGLPELSSESASWIEAFSGHLFERVGLELDAAASRIFPSGRAAALVALEQALSTLSTDPGRPILVGGVDTYLDLGLLATLGAEGRVHGPRLMDGFVPGEGAAFLWIQATSNSPNDPVDAVTRIQAAASAIDPGHRYGTEPARGEGLAAAIEVLRKRSAAEGITRSASGATRDATRGQVPASSGPVATIFAGLNGESFEAKSWGVARLRHKDFFAPQAALQHPADCFGDTGAATGAIFTAMAAAALSKGHRSGPALIWAASDHGSRGCALITTTAPAGN